jgi:hypothetical protein
VIICTDAVAFPYSALILSTNHELIPYLGNIWFRFWSDTSILSNACWKSKLKMHRGVLVVSACAIASRIVAIASMMVFCGTPQYCKADMLSSSTGFNRFAMILAKSLKSVFSNVIGRNSAGVVGFRCFGKQTIVPCLCRGVP